MKTFLLNVMGMLLWVSVSHAQTRTIQGRVTDSGDGTALSGVTITVKGTSVSVQTDAEGHYAIQVSGEQAVLVFTSVGATTREEAVGTRSVVDVTLSADSELLDELVVIGYGTQKKVNLTGAVTVADQKKLANRPITTSSQALQGLNGLHVNQNTAQPGNDQATIRIRGVGTLNNNDPLVLIDGISYPLLDINPNEIESISVLKDAASTAVYGSRAANGVILITTKAGKRGEGYRVSYNNYFGAEDIIKLPDVEWDPINFMKYKNIALGNEGKAPEYTEAEIAEYEQGMAGDPNGYLYPRTNPYDIALKTGFMHEHNVTVSGGGDKHNLAITLGALNQDGILKYGKSKANKYSMGLNGRVDVTDFLSIGAKISGVYRKFDEPQITTNSYWEQAIFRTVPIFPVLIEDGRYGNTWLRSTGLNAWANTLSRLKEGSRDYVRTRILSNVFADLKLPLGITYRANVAANTYDYVQHVFQPYLENVNPKTLVPVIISNTTQGYRRYEKEINLTGFHTLDWNKQFADKHTVSVLLGNSIETFSWEYFNAQKQGSMDNELTDLDVFLTNPTVAGNSTKSAILSYFGRLNYNFDEKYLVEVNFRSDGSSRFARGHRWGLFPSFSLGWRIDQENFMEDVDWITGLKPRFSWGKIGNQEIALWSYINAVGLNQNYSFGTVEAIGAATTAAADPNLSWETTTMTNLGLDFMTFNGRLNTTVELYNKVTDGILRPVNYASQVGDLTGPTTNVGAMRNRGIEVLLNYQDQQGQVSYEIEGSLAYNKNEVTNLNGQEIISGRYITAEGYPVQSYYIYEAEGIFQSDEEVASHAFQNAATKAGFLKYKDQNGDDVIDAKDRKIFAGVVPEYTYSFHLGVGYKGFQLNAFFQGVGKVFTYPQHNVSYPYYNGAGVTKEWETDAWTPENPDARLPILTTSTGNTLNFENSTFWLQNASYLRLKNLQLGYTFPSAIVQKIALKDLKLFVNAQNLLTFTKMKNWDPEKNLTQDNIFTYPQVRTFSAGINVTL
ncbi:SusC/RagA family TonB-linked outer membrane protein [Parapedobacter sp. DT-150]|uniref:SusC/RagA family TonB-linked outer membrane protein n=1 Tax=Parapedobacter sp. DT-150 TaxID=3396162 RepID=UPI003F53EDC2